MNTAESTILVFFAIVLSICFYLLGFGRGWLHGQGSCPKPAERDEETETSPEESTETKQRKASTSSQLQRKFKPNMAASEIKMRLKSKGFCLADVDRMVGVPIGTTSQCITGEARHQKSREAIAKTLDLAVNDIFSESPTLPPLPIKKVRELAAIKQTFAGMGHDYRSIAKACGLASCRVSAMLNGSNYYPSMAEKIETTFGIVIPDMRRKRRQRTA